MPGRLPQSPNSCIRGSSTQSRSFQRVTSTSWSTCDVDELVGLGKAISDGHLVAYYPHLLGVGREIMQRLKSRYEGSAAATQAIRVRQCLAPGG